MVKMMNRIVALAIIFSLVFEQSGFAQVAPDMNIPAYLNGLTGADKFRPMHMRWLSYDAQRNLFDLGLERGDTAKIKEAEIKSSTARIMEYFQIGLRLPDRSFWVNLRPDATGQIIDPYLERTDIGKVMLAADVQLKKDVARFTAPDTREGKLYWNKLYERAEQIFGRQAVTIPTITRPWIVPNEIIIKEYKDGAYVYKATMKVMLEQDYLKGAPGYDFDDPRLKELNEYSSDLIRRLVIPRLTREVNSSKRYSNLRQVFYSLVLAQWFKQRYAPSLHAQAGQTAQKGDSPGVGGQEVAGGKPALAGQQAQACSALLQAIDSRDLTGLSSRSAWSSDTYFRQYQQSFHRGEYNRQETVSGPKGLVIRRYFSGGILFPLQQGAAALRQGVQAVMTILPAAEASTATEPPLLAVLGDAQHYNLAINGAAMRIRVLPRPQDFQAAVAVPGDQTAAQSKVDPGRQLDPSADADNDGGTQEAQERIPNFDWGIKSAVMYHNRNAVVTAGRSRTYNYWRIFKGLQEMMRISLDPLADNEVVEAVENIFNRPYTLAQKLRNLPLAIVTMRWFELEVKLQAGNILKKYYANNSYPATLKYFLEDNFERLAELFNQASERSAIERFLYPSDGYRRDMIVCGKLLLKLYGRKYLLSRTGSFNDNALYYINTAAWEAAQEKLGRPEVADSDGGSAGAAAREAANRADVWFNIAKAVNPAILVSGAGLVVAGVVLNMIWLAPLGLLAIIFRGSVFKFVWNKWIESQTSVRKAKASEEGEVNDGGLKLTNAWRESAEFLSVIIPPSAGLIGGLMLPGWIYHTYLYPLGIDYPGGGVMLFAVSGIAGMLGLIAGIYIVEHYPVSFLRNLRTRSAGQATQTEAGPAQSGENDGGIREGLFADRRSQIGVSAAVTLAVAAAAGFIAGVIPLWALATALAGSVGLTIGIGGATEIKTVTDGIGLLGVATIMAIAFGVVPLFGAEIVSPNKPTEEVFKLWAMPVFSFFYSVVMPSLVMSVGKQLHRGYSRRAQDNSADVRNPQVSEAGESLQPPDGGNSICLSLDLQDMVVGESNWVGVQPRMEMLPALQKRLSDLVGTILGHVQWRNKVIEFMRRAEPGKDPAILVDKLINKRLRKMIEVFAGRKTPVPVTLFVGNELAVNPTLDQQWATVKRQLIYGLNDISAKDLRSGAIKLTIAFELARDSAGVTDKVEAVRNIHQRIYTWLVDTYSPEAVKDMWGEDVSLYAVGVKEADAYRYMMMQTDDGKAYLNHGGLFASAGKTAEGYIKVTQEIARAAKDRGQLLDSYVDLKSFDEETPIEEYVEQLYAAVAGGELDIHLVNMIVADTAVRLPFWQRAIDAQERLFVSRQAREAGSAGLRPGDSNKDSPRAGEPYYLLGVFDAETFGARPIDIRYDGDRGIVVTVSKGENPSGKTPGKFFDRFKRAPVVKFVRATEYSFKDYPGNLLDRQVEITEESFSRHLGNFSGRLGPFKRFPLPVVDKEGIPVDYEATDATIRRNEEIYRDPFGKTWKLQLVRSYEDTVFDEVIVRIRLIVVDEQGAERVIHDAVNLGQDFEQIRQLDNGDLLLILTDEIRRIDLKTAATVWSAPKGRFEVKSVALDEAGGTLWVLYSYSRDIVAVYGAIEVAERFPAKLNAKKAADLYGMVEWDRVILDKRTAREAVNLKLTEYQNTPELRARLQAQREKLTRELLESFAGEESVDGGRNARRIKELRRIIEVLNEEIADWQAQLDASSDAQKKAQLEECISHNLNLLKHMQEELENREKFEREKPAPRTWANGRVVEGRKYRINSKHPEYYLHNYGSANPVVEIICPSREAAYGWYGLAQNALNPAAALYKETVKQHGLEGDLPEEDMVFAGNIFDGKRRVYSLVHIDELQEISDEEADALDGGIDPAERIGLETTMQQQRVLQQAHMLRYRADLRRAYMYGALPTVVTLFGGMVLVSMMPVVSAVLFGAAVVSAAVMIIFTVKAHGNLKKISQASDRYTQAYEAYLNLLEQNKSRQWAAAAKDANAVPGNQGNEQSSDGGYSRRVAQDESIEARIERMRETIERAPAQYRKVERRGGADPYINLLTFYLLPDIHHMLVELMKRLDQKETGQDVASVEKLVDCLEAISGLEFKDGEKVFGYTRKNFRFIAGVLTYLGVKLGEDHPELFEKIDRINYPMLVSDIDKYRDEVKQGVTERIPRVEERFDRYMALRQKHAQQAAATHNGVTRSDAAQGYDGGKLTDMISSQDFVRQLEGYIGEEFAQYVDYWHALNPKTSRLEVMRTIQFSEDYMIGFYEQVRAQLQREFGIEIVRHAYAAEWKMCTRTGGVLSAVFSADSEKHVNVRFEPSGVADSDGGLLAQIQAVFDKAEESIRQAQVLDTEYMRNAGYGADTQQWVVNELTRLARANPETLSMVRRFVTGRTEGRKRVCVEKFLETWSSASKAPEGEPGLDGGDKDGKQLSRPAVGVSLQHVEHSKGAMIAFAPLTQTFVEEDARSARIRAALLGLGSLGWPSAVDALADALHDQRFVRYQNTIVQALGMSRSAEGQQALREFIARSGRDMAVSPSAVRSAIIALGSYASFDSAMFLRRLLTISAYSQYRDAIAIGLGMARFPEAVNEPLENLVKSIGQEEPEVIRAAILALGIKGYSGDMELLFRLKQDPRYAQFMDTIILSIGLTGWNEAEDFLFSVLQEDGGKQVDHTSRLDLEADPAAQTAAAGAAVEEAPESAVRPADEDIGGVDFRAIPALVAPAVGAAGTAGANAAAMTAGAPVAALNVRELDQQWAALQQKVRDGQMPYADIRAYVSACCVNKEACENLKKASLWIAEVLKVEEDACVETSPQMKEVLALL